MAHIVWSKNLSVGIDVIDKQHMRILDYINDLHDAINSSRNRQEHRQRIMDVVNDTIDYTESHFAFEESMLEEVNHPFLKAHKKVHELFVRKVRSYRARLELNEDIAVELRETLSRWLLNHIRSEDADYCRWVRTPEMNVVPETIAATTSATNATTRVGWAHGSIASSVVDGAAARSNARGVSGRDIKTACTFC